MNGPVALTHQSFLLLTLCSSRRSSLCTMCCAGPTPTNTMKLITALCTLGAASAFITPSFNVASTSRASRGPVMMAAGDKSKSIPFLPRPDALPGDGSLAGDVGTFLLCPHSLRASAVHPWAI